LSEYPIGIAFRCGYVEVPEEYSLEIGKWRAASSLSKQYTAKEIFKCRLFNVISKMLILLLKIYLCGGPNSFMQCWGSGSEDPQVLGPDPVRGTDPDPAQDPSLFLNNACKIEF
jgi:hypothetical protein